MKQKFVAEKIGLCWHEFDEGLSSINDRGLKLEFCIHCRKYFLEDDDCFPSFTTDANDFKLVTDWMTEQGEWDNFYSWLENGLWIGMDKLFCAKSFHELTSLEEKFNLLADYLMKEK